MPTPKMRLSGHRGHQEALQVRLSGSHGRVFLIEGNEISTADPVAGLDGGRG
jgi:hypothetical protein